jgi:hypothetical protein
VNDDGRWYVGTFAGTFLGEGGGVVAYLADDGRLIIHEVEAGRYTGVPRDEVDLDMVTGWFPHDPGVTADVLFALGLAPEIDDR